MEQEAIKAALAAKHRPGSLIKRISGVARFKSLLGVGVPGTVRTLLEQVARLPDHSRPHALLQAHAAIAEAFGTLGDDEWRELGAQLLPGLEPSVFATLRALERRPYSQGFTRRPFRAPSSSAMLAAVRGRWLMDVALLVGDYDADIRWIAEHASHLARWTGAVNLGWLLAGAIDAGGETSDDVLELLAATARGEHEISQMGRHVTQALMSCARPEAWELAERLLLAAQRQEGLRQVILESVDEAHPDAFRRMLRVIHEHGLSRFSSVVRAADVWFGFLWDGTSAVKIGSIVERALQLLDDEDVRVAALTGDDAETAYLALWCIAFDDVGPAIPRAIPLLASESPEFRFVATHFLIETGLSTARSAVAGMLNDADLRVASRALDLFGVDRTSSVDGVRLFEQLERLMARLPKRAETLKPIVWPWWKRTIERSRVAAAMTANASAVPGERLLPHVPDLEAPARAEFLRWAAGVGRRGIVDVGVPRKRRDLTAGQRTVALELLGDSSPNVRAAAFDALAGMSFQPDEVERLFELLDRKAGDLRNRAIGRLRSSSDKQLLDVADRLLADASEPRREAGLELLRDAMEKNRATAEVHARIERYTAAHGALSKQEEAHVAAVRRGKTDVASTSDALGLLTAGTVQCWPAPRRHSIEIDTPAARASVESLAELVLAHARTEVRTPSGEVRLLPQAGGTLAAPRTREAVEEGGANVPLRDVWHTWVRERPAELRDDDGHELLRAIIAGPKSDIWRAPAVEKLQNATSPGVRQQLLRGLVEWSIVWDPPARGFEFLVDGLEAAVADFTDGDYREIVANSSPTSVVARQFTGAAEPAFERKVKAAATWLNKARWWRVVFPKTVRRDDAARLYGAIRHFAERSGGAYTPIAHGLCLTYWDFVSAYTMGVLANGPAELIDLLVGPWSARGYGSLLQHVSVRRPGEGLAEHAELVDAVDRCRRRIVEVETERGDRATAASLHAMALCWTGGLDTLSRAVTALGKTHFARKFSWSGRGESRQETLSHLVVRSFPRPEDTPEAFAAWARGTRVSPGRLVELAVYAPQWAAHVNHVLQWPGLEDGVWWIEAHTKDGRSWQLRDVKDDWAAEAGERTPLSADDLTEGAVDVAWFARTYAALGAERWRALEGAAKYAASGAGHTRAQLFARAMSGAVTRDDLVGRIDASRHQDSVRALGLLPLASGAVGKKDLLERYVRLEEFRRQSRKFGSQRQQSEKRAVAIGLENLARTAGYRDPQRLRWAMEQEAVADVARGPLVLTRGDVSLSLSIDEDGVPSLAVTKNGKTLKGLPATLKKDADVDELKERLHELKRQRTRVRGALEEAMCRGDAIGSAELRTLLQHPILAPSLAKLVFIGDGTAGYPAGQGRVLVDHAGKRQALGGNEEVRIAHPHDLWSRGDWSAWQRECFAAERVQPFKQVFRELYPITDAERGMTQSRRYAGHQVHPQQSVALLGGRGWVVKPEEGVNRTFHDEGITAHLSFQEAFFTPAEIEGLTLEALVFTNKGNWAPLRLDTVPSRLLSEAMRDLDLVVSVAHRGAVDPEATASTVEMRAILIRETCALLRLENVELLPNHAIVKGKLGTYSVHLGSGNAMLMPSTSLPIVAVHSQHRGRLFLPFADDDPRTAEVLSKVLLLARDHALRDPGILERIRHGR
jgi:uncharacterized protein DUF5724/uncharacterized protein DUF4132